MPETTLDERLVKIALTGGRYEGELTAAAETGVEAVHLGQVIATARVLPTDRPGVSQVRIDLPPSVLSDGVQVVSLMSTSTGAVLDRLTVLAGDALDEDIRAEVALLREELEMLKRAFRRHVSGASG